MLREMLEKPQEADEGMSDSHSVKDGRHGSEDSGYYSRRESKTIGTSGRRESIFTEQIGEVMEGIEGQDLQADDEVAEEADDEGAGLEDLDKKDGKKEEGKGDGKSRLSRTGDEDEEGTAKSSPHKRTPTAERIYHPFPQFQMGNRFISPLKPAAPRLSAEEALVARGRYPGEGK